MSIEITEKAQAEAVITAVCILLVYFVQRNNYEQGPSAGVIRDISTEGRMLAAEILTALSL